MAAAAALFCHDTRVLRPREVGQHADHLLSISRTERTSGETMEVLLTLRDSERSYSGVLEDCWECRDSIGTILNARFLRHRPRRGERERERARATFSSSSSPANCMTNNFPTAAAADRPNRPTRWLHRFSLFSTTTAMILLKVAPSCDPKMISSSALPHTRIRCNDPKNKRLFKRFIRGMRNM